MTARLAQVIFTATQFDNADEVLFWLDGTPVEFFGGEGIVLDDAQQRQDVDWAFTKGIIIDTPLPGATVTSPITVTGEGDVFEADFPMEVRRNGERISDVVIVFAGAWGNWADFQTTISVDAPPGPIELVALSPMGCTPRHRSQLPGRPRDHRPAHPHALTSPSAVSWDPHGRTRRGTATMPVGPSRMERPDRRRCRVRLRQPVQPRRR